MSPARQLIYAGLVLLMLLVVIVQNYFLSKVVVSNLTPKVITKVVVATPMPQATPSATPKVIKGVAPLQIAPTK